MKEKDAVDKTADRFICEALFTTITNVAWDNDVIIGRIRQALKIREGVKEKLGAEISGALPDCAVWTSDYKEAIMAKALSDELRIAATENEDVRSLKEMLVIGCKGIAAYADHAAILGHEVEPAKKCAPPQEIESGKIVGGFAHHQVLALADKVIDAVKSGVIKRFVVMAGCDGRQKARNYFTEVAESLPKDTVILTAGCAKYRYNKLALGDIGGIPRVLDAGQCNDSYLLAVIALKLKEAFDLDDINELPISYDIAWYEQKAVAVLLALLFLGVKGIRLGPTLPGFLSANMANVLVENFDVKPIGTVGEDIAAMIAVN